MSFRTLKKQGTCIKAINKQLKTNHCEKSYNINNNFKKECITLLCGPQVTLPPQTVNWSNKITASSGTSD